jgi:predicted SAM-dependent methyltransferase
MSLIKYCPQYLQQSAVYRQLSRKRRQWKLRKELSNANPLRVVLGAGPTRFPGWFHTDKELLDVTSLNDWDALFVRDSIDALLSEHMLEHLTENEACLATSLCFRYLKPGGVFRVAVPDGYRRDPVYAAAASSKDEGHHVVYNVDSLSALLQNAGFATTPLEHFDAEERFHTCAWDGAYGLIQRSARFDSQREFERGDLCYTSLIVDARKP